MLNILNTVGAWIIVVTLVAYVLSAVINWFAFGSTQAWKFIQIGWYAQSPIQKLLFPIVIGATLLFPVVATLLVLYYAAKKLYFHLAITQREQMRLQLANEVVVKFRLFKAGFNEADLL